MTKQQCDFDVSYVAGLARIAITPEEEAEFDRDMKKIMAYIDQLNELDVSGIEPTAHAAPLTNVWREDVPAESSDAERESLLRNAPAVLDDSLVKVPTVLPGEGMS